MSKSGKKKTKKPQGTTQDKNTPQIENVGNYLRTLRIEKGLSISDVCEATRISETNLNAIEDRNFSALPADTFVRGLLNIYAKFLDLDAPHIVARFLEERDESQKQGRRGRAKQQKTLLAPKRLAEPAHVSSVTMAGVLLLVIVIIFTGFCLYTSWNPFSFLIKESDSLQSFVMDIIPDSKSEKTEVPPVSDNKKISPAEQEQNIPASSTTLQRSKTDSDITANGYTLTVRFTGDTKVDITRDDGEPASRTYSNGEEQTWTAASSMTVTFDKPATATILVNNNPIGFPEEKDGLFTLRIPADIPALPADE